jgi:hypothetical protein
MTTLVLFSEAAAETLEPGAGPADASCRRQLSVFPKNTTSAKVR